MLRSASYQDSWEPIKSDITRLVTRPLFWLMGAFACVVSAAAYLPGILWVTCAPLLLRNSDFFTWAVEENPKKFKGRIVWVTGGSTGIGLAICKQLSLRDLKGLIITGRSLARLETARNAILAFSHSQGGRMKEEDILLLPLDLSKGIRVQGRGADDAPEMQEAWEETIHKAVHWRGGVDILFNNAGTHSTQELVLA
ncbi:short-chain dehydrogenase reductase family protein [Cyclospora cayetanensis]|uniref:Short-chain dehydrogenase reductase family protein n=1 Tax=Cyclospora cayetanensis TaxID=88456 RepID=A0A1D3D0Z8_9EIME|nr:short-chain dehydrogenase reductase family protein [Cyclospora cayetanensis]